MCLGTKISFFNHYCSCCSDSLGRYGTTVLNDLKTYMESLQAMLDFQPRRLYPGHGPIIKDGVGEF